MKKFFSAITVAVLTVLFLCVGLVGCGGTETVALTFNKTSVEMNVGDTERLIATPEKEIEGLTLNYTSSKPAVATVSQTGKVVAKSAGETIITAQYGTASATCKIKVNSISITISEETLTLDVMENNTATLTASCSNEGAVITWASSDENVVTVDADGVVYAVGNGTATVSALVGKSAATCTVNVSAPEGWYKVKMANNSVVYADPGVFYGYVAAASATDFNGYYYNGEAVVSIRQSKVSAYYVRYQPVMEGYAVDDLFSATTTVVSSISGFVRMGGGGETTLMPIEANVPTQVVIANRQVKADTPLSIAICTTENANDYAIGEYTIKVASFVVSEGLKISQTSLELVGAGQTAQLSVESEGEAVWTSSDESVATVDSNGLVSAVGDGACTVTVAVGDKTAKCQVVVVARTVSLSERSVMLNAQGQTRQLTATVSDGEGVVWTSSDESVATVDENGVVSAVGSGIATVRCSAGDYFDECQVIACGENNRITYSYLDGESTLPGSGTAGNWYQAGYFGKTTMKDGTLTIDYDDTKTFSTKSFQQIRYKPTLNNTTEAYIGSFYFVMTISNNTNKAMQYSANINGQAANTAVSLGIGEQRTVVWQFSRTAEEADQQLNIKLYYYGEGTVVLSDIYLIPIAA